VFLNALNSARVDSSLVALNCKVPRVQERSYRILQEMEINNLCSLSNDLNVLAARSLEGSQEMAKHISTLRFKKDKGKSFVNA
jgi:hypothetical protein